MKTQETPLATPPQEGETSDRRFGVGVFAGGMAIALVIGVLVGYFVSPDGADPAALEASRQRAEEAEVVAEDAQEAAAEANAQAEDERQAALRYQETVTDQQAEIRQLENRIEALESSPQENGGAGGATSSPRGTIPEDGIWQAGPAGDFPPGTYRSSAGGNCYWARLGSPGGNNILANGFGPNATVQIGPREWFESADCAPWEQIG